MDFNKIYNAAYSEYYHEIYYYCLKKHMSVQDAEDCTQEVFLVFWRKLAGMNLVESVSSWLFATADMVVKRCKSQNNKYAINENLENVPEHFLVCNPFENVNTEIELDDMLTVLKPEDRKILTEYYRYGKTTAEFSKELSISEDAVRRRIGRARNKIAESLQSENIVETDKSAIVL